MEETTGAVYGEMNIKNLRRGEVLKEKRWYP